jgi:glycosyltransferase involved in cell wall biosynthesis
MLGDRVTIGQWGWETDVLPSSWNPAKRLVDEVWVYSRFVAENLGRVLPVPVVVVPPAVVVPDITGIEPPDFARSDRFKFLFICDLLSTERRKNVCGLIEAYTRAFSAADGARLLIKTINGRLRERQFAELRARAQGRPDVEIVDAYLSPSEKAALIASVDCYVSLHRSEGFGLPLAEAMALGTPVITTGYSGNLDFTTPFNSYLVDWSLGKVGPGSEIYPEYGAWAEPDLDHAALQMQTVAADPIGARKRAERAQREVSSLFSPAAVGAVARARLQELYENRSG